MEFTHGIVKWEEAHAPKIWKIEMDLGVERLPRSENLKCQKKNRRMPNKKNQKETFY